MIRLLKAGLFTALLLSLSTPALAQRAGGNGMDSAIRSVERQTGGQVLSAERRQDNGKVYYRVKVLTPDGRVRIIRVNAR